MASTALALLLPLSPPNPPLLPLQLSLLATTLYTSLKLLASAPSTAKPLLAPTLASLPPLCAGLYTDKDVLPAALASLTLTGAALLDAHRGKRRAAKKPLLLSLATLYTALATADPATALKTVLLGLAVLALPPRKNGETQAQGEAP